MKRNARSIFLSISMLLTLLVASCGGAGAGDPSITTAVAMTVAAHETQAAGAASTPTLAEAGPTSTPEAGDATPTPTRQTSATFSPPTAPPAVGSTDPCLLANLVSETIPDGQIMTPGQYFWKTWRLKNGGSCTWDSTYKIVYWSGELMGGLSEYPFPEVVPPGDEVEITIYMQAPSSNGNYTSSWKIQSPWGGSFGVGEYDQPFYVQVNVTDSSKPGYGVTAVTYQVVRDPAAGCATNVWYTVNATITTNGPAEVYYRWLQSDGNDTGDKKLKFTEAGSQTLTREWSMHLGVTPGTKWMQVLITSQDVQDFGKAYFDYLCQ
ncbi:MAG: NBR1-Ig-like domain-containing protein [Chloroflexota bacterium]